MSAGTPVVIPFVGCDREGLQNALRLPSSTDDRVFTVDATQPSGTSPLIVTITYEESSGHFAAAFTAAQPGDYELRLLLDGEHVGDTLRLSAGCACITGMVLQSDGSCAFCPQGTGAAACAARAETAPVAAGAVARHKQPTAHKLRRRASWAAKGR